MNSVELSKAVSHALRHAPEEYDLDLDDEGWVEIGLLIRALGKKKNEWAGLNIEDLRNMISQSEKTRHEIDGNYIRAIYGHSVEGKFQTKSTEPPQTLYHGTSHKAASVILKEGLKSMDRQYVHLSQMISEATRVGKRKDSVPVILKINAQKAYEEGVKFYKGNERIWLADFISSKFLSVLEDVSHS